MLTVKSDDVLGRVKVYEALVKGQQLEQAGVPESFRVLMKEFQALGLDVGIQNDEGELLDLKEVEEAEYKEETKPDLPEDFAPPLEDTEESIEDDDVEEEVEEEIFEEEVVMEGDED
jgi:DNA-directed RNA polymerase subunit beta